MATICAELKFYPVHSYTSDKVMPDKICRTCGEELVGYSQCSECKRSIQQICIKCGRRTIERFHLKCFSQTRYGLSMPTNIALAE